jgi:hypothetical protein
LRKQKKAGHRCHKVLDCIVFDLLDFSFIWKTTSLLGSLANVLLSVAIPRRPSCSSNPFMAQFHQRSIGSFCAGRFTPRLTGARRKAYSLEVEHNF